MEPETPSWLNRGLAIALGGLTGLLLGWSGLKALGFQGGLVSTLLVALVAAIGLLAGFVGHLLLVGDEEEEHDEPEPLPAEVTDPGRGATTTTRIFALGRRVSSDLKPMRVEFRSAPMAPPDMEIELIIEQYDGAARTAKLEGVLARMGVEQVLERVLSDVNGRCPPIARDHRPTFAVTGFRSEGPLTPEGISAQGWTFYFVDGDLGLGCVATNTDREVSLQYHTAVTFHRPVREERRSPAEAMRIALEALPELAAHELWIRVSLPDEVLLFVRDPLVVIDVDLDRGVVRNAEAVRPLLATHAERRAPLERFRLSSILAWSRGDVVESSATVGDAGAAHGPLTATAAGDGAEAAEDGTSGDDFGKAIGDRVFAEDLRTFTLPALQRTTRALMRGEGSALPALLEAVVARSISEGTAHEDGTLALWLLAAHPSGLATARLHGLSCTLEDPALRALADDLFTRRRRRELGVAPDPIGQLRLPQLQAAMGTSGLIAVPLLSTYDPERALLEKLERLGLRLSRTRWVSGDSKLLLTAYLRSTGDGTDGMMTSIPLPMPCHMLHLVGPNAAELERRVRQAGVVYTEDARTRDLQSNNPHAVHRAAMYLTALREASPVGSEPLLGAYQRGRLDVNLRRAVLNALEYTVDDAGEEFLERVARGEGAQPDDQALAQAVLARRGGGSAQQVDGSEGLEGRIIGRRTTMVPAVGAPSAASTAHPDGARGDARTEPGGDPAGRGQTAPGAAGPG